MHHAGFSVLLLFLSLFYLSFGLDSNDVDIEIAEIESFNQNENKDEEERCFVPDGNMDCDDTIVDKSVAGGTLCFFVTWEGPDVLCVDGELIETNAVQSSERERRTHSICRTIRSRRRSGWRRRRRRRARTSCYEPNHAPYFTNCSSPLSFTTPSQQTSMQVTWTVPSATDIEDGALSVIQTSGQANGAELQGSAAGTVYNVYYTSGADAEGLTAQCQIQITVKVIVCSTPSTPAFGKVECSGTNYGHSCSYTCANGYEPTVTSVQCQSNGQWTNGGSSECEDSDPPVLSGCPSDILMTADIGQTSAVVTWNLPTASDNQDTTIPDVEQSAGSISPDSRVDNGIVHTVKYVAHDSAGNPSEECSFNVQVKVTRCLSISAPQNGHYQCDKGFIYGSQCSFSCDQGYILQGGQVSACGQDGTWDTSPPTCDVIECLQPDQYGITLPDGYFYCPSPITYQTVCQPVCNSGFELKQYTTLLCTTDADNNATFSVSVQPECLDTEPPTFVDCDGTTVLTFSAERGKTTAVVEYDIPTATDNSDPSPIVKSSGPNSGDTVDTNAIEYVEFQATDDAGNPSTRCTYVLQVDVTECSAYIPPSNGQVSCTADYIYGSICNLACSEGYENLGPLSSECLESGSWNVTDFECTKVMCPSSPVPPENGAYICPSITYPYNTICYTDCNPGFDLSQWSYARCKADQTWEISSTSVCIDSEPPVFTDCILELEVQAEIGVESAVVTWTVPAATDNVDSSPIVTKLSGPDPGDRIEGEVTVTYQATDQAGNPSELCTMHITVEVIRCSSPQWPEDGSITCDLGDIYGSACSYTCDEGYEISTPSTAVCEVYGSWSYGSQPPSCSPITCGPPPSVSYGEFFCPSILYQYQSVCSLACSSGYSVGPNAVTAVCLSTGEWSISANETCMDSTPPDILNCKTYQPFYADRGLDTAQVTWTVPTAIDNADNQNEITIEQLSGPPIGSNISIGTTVVEYRAVDTAGNPSSDTCSITINVEAVYCFQPKYYFNDTNLEFICTSYKWGDTCTPTCSKQASLTLKGPDVITCEATFSGTTVSTSWVFEGSLQPYCEAEVCERSYLNVPQNGALTFTNEAQPIVFVTCNENFDLPYQFNGLVLCLDSGLWNPDAVPDCTRTRRPGLSLLPVEYYYSGECSSQSAEEAVKDQVLLILEDFIGSALAPACLSGSTCGYEDLAVECGATRKKKDTYEDRRKRQASSIHVRFSLTITGNVTNWDELIMFEENLFQISDILQDAVIVDETFHLNGYEVVSGSYAREVYSQSKCEGGGQVGEGFTCKSCAAGMYLDDTSGTKSCVKCPVGTYMDYDGATTCINCPTGTSTNITGAKSVDMCVELCPAGYSSVTTVQPCSPCLIGYQQDSIGQIACSECEFGKTTFGIGSPNCSYYDIVLNEQEFQQLSVPLNASTVLDSFSVLFWVYISNGSHFGVSFESGVVISISEDIVISWNGVSMGVPLPYSLFNKWVHLAVTLTSTMFSIYFNGEVLGTQQLVWSVAIPADTTAELLYSGENDIRLTSLALYSHVLTADEIASHRESCAYDISAALFTSDDLLNANVGIVTEPSSCKAIDYCTGEPCGPHLCTSTVTGFLCTCSGGYQGTTCETAPDNCYQNECQNGATCVSSSTAYTCVCQPGFRGHFCQNLPINGGWSSWSSWGLCNVSCGGGVKQRTRACDNPSPGQYGTQCIGDMIEESQCNTEPCNITNPCLANPCGAHRCLEISNGFICKCNSGYTGDLCQTEIDYCETNPCQNKGTCENGVGNFSCICPEKFGGEICDEAEDAPSYWTSWSQCTVTCNGGVSSRTRVCAQNSNCVNQSETRSCNNVSCIVDYCQSSPCGTKQCISSEQGFVCICGPGFTGSTCDTPVDFCEQNSCENGQCNNTESGYECICDEGYSGDLCNISPRDGGLGVWIEWSDCSTACGSGQRLRNRTCDNPPPSLGGKTCDGKNEETEICHAECYDACLSSPCGTEHGCTADGTGYKCSCKDGYTGSQCSISPDNCLLNPCENAAECVSTPDGFTCTCVDGYSGTTCEIEPDESVWGAWSGWDSCSASCGGGTQSRQRGCKVGTKGENCAGNQKEERECGEDQCPSCPSLSRFYGMVKSCNTNESVTTCTMRCLPGYYPPNSTYSADSWAIIYQCGPFSSYQWNLTDEKLSCSRGSGRPSFVTARAILVIVPTISCGKASYIEDIMSNRVSYSVCRSRVSCIVYTAVTKCSNRKRRQTGADESEITFTFTFDFGIDTETGNSSDMSEYWDTVEEALSSITTNGGDWLSVEIDGVTYVADSTNVTKEASVECSNGLFLQDEYDICVGCSPGTMYDSELGYCLSCPLGTYQDLVAQYSCISCPDGHTTNVTGSYDQYDCYYSGEDEADTDGSTSSNGVIIGVAVGGCVCGALVAAALIGTVLVKAKRARMKSIIHVSAVDLNDGDVEQKDRKVFERMKTSNSILSASHIPMTIENIE